MKVFNTISEKTIYKTLWDFLKIEEDEIKFYIRYSLKSYSYLDEVDIFDFLYNYVEKTDKLYEMLYFDYITLFHYTTRLDNNLWDKPFYNLFDVLTKETEISRYLNEKGLEFIVNKELLSSYYYGEKIDWLDICKDNPIPQAYMIKRRFEKVKKYGVDKCINGFLFNGNIYEHESIEHLKECPEIIQNMSTVLKRKDIVDDWKMKAKKFILCYKVNIVDLIFDGKPNLTRKQKIFRIYRYILMYLARKLLNTWEEDENPVILLKDSISLSPESIVSISNINI